MARIAEAGLCPRRDAAIRKPADNESHELFKIEQPGEASLSMKAAEAAASAFFTPPRGTMHGSRKGPPPWRALSFGRLCERRPKGCIRRKSTWKMGATKRLQAPRLGAVGEKPQAGLTVLVEAPFRRLSWR